MQIQQMPESNQTTFPLNNFAERRGFEPRKPFGSLHAFQACLFNHSSISPSLKSACDIETRYTSLCRRAFFSQTDKIHFVSLVL